MAALALHCNADAHASDAVLRGLDKVTGRTETITLALNEPLAFGSLRLTLRHCHKNPPEEPADNAAFLEIQDKLTDGREVPVFSGWMFSSSPALSSLEHPVYDVWVLDCPMDDNASGGGGSE